jgi:hypothetical protein
MLWTHFSEQRALIRPGLVLSGDTVGKRPQQHHAVASWTRRSSRVTVRLFLLAGPAFSDLAKAFKTDRYLPPPTFTASQSRSVVTGEPFKYTPASGHWRVFQHRPSGILDGESDERKLIHPDQDDKSTRP